MDEYIWDFERWGSTGVEGVGRAGGGGGAPKPSRRGASSFRSGRYGGGHKAASRTEGNSSCMNAPHSIKSKFSEEVERGGGGEGNVVKVLRVCSHAYF